MARFQFNWKRFVFAFVIAGLAVIAAGKAMSKDNSKPASQQAPSEASGTQTVLHEQRTDLNAPDKTSRTPDAVSNTATTAGAQKVSAPSDYKGPTWQSYYERADAIRADTEITNAELENLEVHHKLDEARQGKFDSPTQASGSTGLSAINLPQSMPPAVAPVIDVPARTASVYQTSMVDDQWVATIRLPSGVLLNNVRNGQQVPGVGRVTSINLNEVLVSSGGKTVSLPFPNDDGANQGTTISSASPPEYLSRPMSIAPPLGLH